MNEPTEEGGGPEGVVEGCEGRCDGDDAVLPFVLVLVFGVEGSEGLEENGTSKGAIVKESDLDNHRRLTTRYAWSLLAQSFWQV